MKRARTRLGAPIYPNAGNAAVYRRRLEALIDEMHRSLAWWLCARWRDAPPVLAQDESPADGLRRTMRQLGRRWQSRFDAAAPSLAELFAKRTAERVAGKLEEILDGAGIPTVKFTTTPAVRDALSATIGENVGLIRSIASEHLSAVEGLVMRSISEGRDLSTLAKALEARYQLTKKRAAFIARDQSNKGTAVIARVRQQEAGITEAVWTHSRGGKVPRPTHVAQSGKRYSVSEGWLDPAINRRIWPGTEISCRCVSRPVIAGFE